MSTRQVLGAVGAAIGGYFGGPTGAQWGWAIGSAIGGAVDPEIIRGPSIGDIAEQTSMEGGPRPIVFALSPPIAGNIIASGEPKIVRRRERQGKGGPKVETESVYRTYAIGVSETVGGFVRVWRNGTLVYDVSTSSIVDDETNAKFLQTARFFIGDYEQLPSPDLETVLGVGLTPAHRGTAYMVMADEDLTDLRGAIPQWMFQVQRCGVAQAAILAINSGGNEQQVLRSTDGENFAMVDTPANPLSPGDGFQWSGIAHANEIGTTVMVSDENVPVIAISLDQGATWELVDTTSLGSNGQFKGVAWSPALTLFAAVRESTTHAIATSPDGRDWTLVATPSFINAQSVIWQDASELFVAGQNVSGSAVMTSANGSSWTLRSTPSGRSAYEMDDDGLHTTAVGRDDFMMQSADGGVTWSPFGQQFVFGITDLAFDKETHRCLLVSIFGAYLSNGLGGFDQIDPLPTGGMEGVCHSKTFGGFYVSTTSSGQPNMRMCKLPDGFNTIQGISTPSAANLYSWIDCIAIDTATAGSCAMTVAQVVTEISDRAGLPASLIDVTELEDLDCRGLMVINSYPCFTALRSLSEIFLFDPSSSDGTVNFIRRGANTVATITEADMLDDESDIEQAKRSDAISIPRVLNINYHDVAGGIATDKQSSERSGDRRSVGEANIQSAVLMIADEAAQAAAINHKIMIEDHRGELKYCLPDSFIRLVPTDNVIVQWQGRSVRARIARCDVNDGYQEYLCLRDRQSAYTSDVEGIPAAPQTPPPSSVVGPTLIEPLDIHILMDADDNVGLLYYVAVSGVLQAWQGALVELSRDSGANYTESASTRVSAVMGEITAILPDHPAEFPDEVNTVTVMIDTPFAELSETDLTGMMNGLNLAIIGDELIQFANADEIVEGTWQLSLLLRGRKGSQTASHAVGDRFVLLERDNIAMIPASISDIGRALTFRATSFGTSVETGTVVTMTFTGRSQIEREPAYLMAHRDGVNAVVTWQGVGRLGSGATVAQGMRFTGYRVTFDDGAIEQVVETTAQEITHNVSALSSPITIRVAQLNGLTGAGPEIEVIIT